MKSRQFPRSARIGTGAWWMAAILAGATFMVSSTAALIAFNEGIDHAAFGVALTLAIIVILDASSLRRAVGKHAVLINQLTTTNTAHAPLRERMGHSPLEILAGIILGVGLAYIVHRL